MTRNVLAYPKPVRLQDKIYLAWVRRQPCVACGAASQAHHSKTKGARGSDYRALPMCFKHHEELHRRGKAFMEIEYRVDIREELIRLLETYVSALRSGEME